MKKRHRLALWALGILLLIYVANFGMPGAPAPRAAITAELTPPGVTDCATGITPQAADQLSELDLYNARIWIMRECNGVTTLHPITQATLDCEAAISAQYPDPIAHQLDIYNRAMNECPDEQTGTLPDGTQIYWHQR